jgi:hypothetical protein
MNVTRKSFSLFFSFLCIFVLVACIPTTPVPPPPDVAITLTVQAIQLEWFTQTAQALQAQPIIIVVTATPDPNLAPTTDPAVNTALLATTSSTVTLTVSQSTNCRLGPSQDFDEIGSLGPGQIAEVVGKDTFNNHWIIKLPDGSGKTCWLWGQYATVTGDTSTVAQMATPTPAASSGAPNAPTLLDAQVKCTRLCGKDYQYKFVIYSSNGGAFTTPPNKTSFSFEENVPADTTMSVSLSAANEKGESAPASAGGLKCP